MKRRTFKILLYLFGGAACLFLFASAALLLWVMTGPRSLDNYKSYIEAALAPEGSGYKVRIGSSEVFWDSVTNPVEIRVKDVNILLDNDMLFASFPEVVVGMDFPSLLIGKTRVKSLRIRQPVISLYQMPDGDITFGIGSGKSPPVSLRQLLSGSGEGTAGGGGVASQLSYLAIEDANLSIGNEKRGVFFTAPHVQLKFLKNRHGAQGFLDLGIQYEQKNSLIAGEFALRNADRKITGKLLFNEISPSRLSKIFQLPEEVGALSLPVSGKIDFQFDTAGEVDFVNFIIKTGKGTVAYPKAFAKPFEIKEFSAEGMIVDGLSTVILHQMEIAFDKPRISASGVITKLGDDYFVDMLAKGSAMPVNDLKNYWPSSLAPITRDWVTTRITDGTVPDAYIRLVIQPGYRAYEFLPQDAIEARVDVKGASVLYLPKHPKVTEANGSVYFDGRRMDIAIDSGKKGVGTIVKLSKIEVPDLTAIDTQMLIDLNLSAPAVDIASFMASPDINLASRLNVIPDSIRGSAEGNVKLDFIAFSENPTPATESIYDNVKYDISGRLQNVSQKQFLKKYDIDDFDGTIALNNNGITLQGRAVTEGEKLLISYLSDDTAKDGYDEKYKVKGSLPTTLLNRLGYMNVAGITGRGEIDADIKENDKTLLTHAVVDATATEIAFPSIGFKKEKNTSATATLTVESDKSSGSSIITLQAKGQGLEADGKLLLDKGDNITQADFKTMKYGKNDAAVFYRTDGAGYAIRAKGKSLDLEPYFKANENNTDYSLSTFPAVKADIALDTVYMKAGSTLHNVSSVIDCSREKCAGVAFAANLSDNSPFRFYIRSKAGARELTAEAANAGEALRTLNIHDTIMGGTLSLSGSFDDSKPTHPLSGKLFISDYTLTKAPVLAKLLTFASLTGFIDTLGGKGIAFKKLSAPFVLEKDVIRLKDAKAYGSAIGIDAKGTIALKGLILDLKGTVVPSYTLNSFFGKIPVFGEILAGGSGKGLIAANYSMKGANDDPTISVNPLSILTPGFLRGMFDVFDEPSGKQKGKKADYNKKSDDPKPSATTKAKLP